MLMEARQNPGTDIEALNSTGEGLPEYVRIRNNDLGTISTTVISGVINGVTFSLEVPDGCANTEVLSVQVVQAIRESASLPATDPVGEHYESHVMGNLI
jgi:hypothetical protein